MSVQERASQPNIHTTMSSINVSQNSSAVRSITLLQYVLERFGSLLLRYLFNSLLLGPEAGIADWSKLLLSTRKRTAGERGRELRGGGGRGKGRNLVLL